MNDPIDQSVQDGGVEGSFEELLSRATAPPATCQMAIDCLGDAEGVAVLAAMKV